jgi:methylenetetrahydrofolate dehydrogenase (NADP+)/methenyltetrahydrofolate cyclohydrolase
MVAPVINGAAIAASLRSEIAATIAKRRTRGLRAPGLAVVLVGDDPASQVYVRSKAKLSGEAGMRSFEHKLRADVSEPELLDLVAQLNANEDVDGILVQLPLPRGIDFRCIIEAIDPQKDVDGFHPVNAGRLAAGLPGFVPCTPLGCIFLLEKVRPDISGLSAVVIGRSNIVGKPMAQFLLAKNCTVTIAHSQTRDLPAVCRQADILVAAIGRPQTVRGNWIKPGAVVLDVGINRLAPEPGREKGRLVGDVAYEEALGVAGAVTPVPGGIGPMTIACLLSNTLDAARRRDG